ncbi:MAG: glycosyltransferase family 39 protein [Phototrophicaceae bacterium]
MIKQTQTSQPIKWHQIVALIIISFSFFMSALVSERVFERLPHLEDELAYLYQARIFAGGQVVVTSPQPTAVYWQPFLVDSSTTGNRFGKYTPGWSALLSLGVLLGYEQIVNALFAALTVALVYRLGREIFNPDVGVIAALLVAFSPAALLLNASLMSHTTGLFFTTLFIYAYWRIEKTHHRYGWGLVAGLSLGVLAATRPLTTLGIALPFIAWSAIRVLMPLVRTEQAMQRLKAFSRVLMPLLILSGAALILASSIPAFSYAATGDPTQNLYELVWDYDRIGFGECCGRNFHRLEKAINHARFDLSLTAADLFGWQVEPINADMVDHFQNGSDTYSGKGYSFYLLPLGIILGLFAQQRKIGHIALIVFWTIGAFFWVWLPFNLTANVFGFGRVADILNLDPQIIADVGFSWFWVITALIWLFLPLIVWVQERTMPHVSYTWLLLSVVGSVVIIQMLYWIGSQRYSTRYYYEALSAAAILTAIPLAMMIRLGYRYLNDKSEKLSMLWRFMTYGALLMVCLFTLYSYSTPRIMALYRFNGISPDLIEQVENARVDDRQILAIINGATTGEQRIRWRAYAALMAVTSPYLDSDIVAARMINTTRQDLINAFPDRQIIDLNAAGDDAVVQTAP